MRELKARLDRLAKQFEPEDDGHSFQICCPLEERGPAGQYLWQCQEIFPLRGKSVFHVIEETDPEKIQKYFHGPGNVWEADR